MTTNRDYLEFSGFSVEVAANGREAIDRALALKPDLILMDASMPVLDGWQATRELKANPATKHIPVLALTAHAFDDARQEARSSGCDGFVDPTIRWPDQGWRIRVEPARSTLLRQTAGIGAKAKRQGRRAAGRETAGVSTRGAGLLFLWRSHGIYAWIRNHRRQSCAVLLATDGSAVTLPRRYPAARPGQARPPRSAASLSPRSTGASVPRPARRGRNARADSA